MHFRLKAECPRYLSNGLQSQICCSSQLLHHDFVQCTDFQSTFQRTLRLSEEHCIAQVKSIVLVCRRQILFQMFEPWSIKIAAQQQKLGLHTPAPIHKFSHWQVMLCLSLKCQHFFISLFINSHQNPKCCNSWPQMRQNRWNGAKQVISQGSVLPRLQITTFLGLAILRPKWQISSTANTENKSSFNFSYISSWLKNLPRFREIPFLSTKERQYNDGHFT